MQYRFQALLPYACILIFLAACRQPGLIPYVSPVKSTNNHGNPNLRPVRCNDWRHYVPDTLHPDHQRPRILRVNFHVMNSADSTHNFREKEGRIYLKRLLQLANSLLDSNGRNWRSPEGLPVLPIGYSYRLTPQPQQGDDGIYFHYDDALYYFVSAGRYQNNYDNAVITKYAVGLDSIINIFIMVHPDDSLRSPTYRPGSQGIALGNGLKMAGIYEHKQPPEDFDGLLNHEIGHILGLGHAWVEDGCPDTDLHPNKCWVWAEEGPCRDLATNNMMDYNAWQHVLTPCQIGKVLGALASERYDVRKCLIPVWCERTPGRDIIIRDSTDWNGARDLEGNLTIAPGGRLTIRCRVSIPADCKIVVQPGGILYLDGARLHNACGRTWKGVFLEGRLNNTGKVIEKYPATFENIPGLK